MRPRALGSIVGLILLLGLVLPASAGGPQSPQPGLRAVIVVFDDAVVDPVALTARLGAQHGFAARHAYSTALKGFAASVPDGAVAALSGHPLVRLVEPEVAERIVDQVLPTGIDRIEVDQNPNADVDGSGNDQVTLPVAVIDTGIGNHADLNVLGRVSFSGGDGFDKNGHGTHVAGTIGAVGNTTGVVGVAPGAPVHGVQVCKPGGICMSGDIVAGINHVAERKAEANNGGADGDPGINFASANFSISSSDTTQSCNASGQGVNATHTAICGLVAQGVVFAMAAGNDARQKSAYPEAFTVAAIADFDGAGGKAGSPTCRSDEDDTLANFSNWGVDIAAPGTCILSTWNDGGYNTISGTSMATPHVTGAVALYLHANNAAPATNATGVTSIESAILLAARPEGTDLDPCSYDNERGTTEALLFVNDLTHFKGSGECTVAGGTENAPPTVTLESPTDGDIVSGNVAIQIAASDTEDAPGTLTVEWNVDGGTWQPTTYDLTTDRYVASWDSTTASEGTRTVTAQATDSATKVATDSNSVTVDNFNDPPTASFTHTCSGLTCSFDGSSSSDDRGIASYAWDFGDGSTDTLSGVTVSHTYAGPGTYTVTLTVTDTDGVTDSEPKAVVVATTMHVGDLDGSSTNQGSSWTALVTITVHDASHNGVAGAVVSGTFVYNGNSVGKSCTTETSGACTVSLSGILKRYSSVTFDVTGIDHSSLTYDATANHDPDIDSNGTSITVIKP